MKKTKMIYMNYDEIREGEKEYAIYSHCYQVDDDHVASYETDEGTVYIEPITEITDEGIVVRYDDERPTITLYCEYIDESNFVDDEFWRFLKYLIKLKETKK